MMIRRGKVRVKEEALSTVGGCPPRV